jgi:hypothetical protein
MTNCVVFCDSCLALMGGPDQFQPASDSRNIDILGSARSHETGALEKLFGSRFQQKSLDCLGPPAVSMESVRAPNLSVSIPNDSSQGESFLDFFWAGTDRAGNLGQPGFDGVEIMKDVGWPVGRSRTSSPRVLSQKLHFRRFVSNDLLTFLFWDCRHFFIPSY